VPGPNSSEHLARDARRADVQEDEIEVVRIDHFQSGGAILGVRNVEILALTMSGCSSGQRTPIVWEMWAVGFAKAVALRPEAWTVFAALLRS
jgi:hypothetical protein